MKNKSDLSNMRSLTEKVMGVYIGRFLDPNITAGQMITVFDLVEQNIGGKLRLQRLIEEDLVVRLTAQQCDIATELLEDYPSRDNES